jgi:hypothetical protein
VLAGRAHDAAADIALLSVRPTTASVGQVVEVRSGAYKRFAPMPLYLIAEAIAPKPHPCGPRNKQGKPAGLCEPVLPGPPHTTSFHFVGRLDFRHNPRHVRLHFRVPPLPAGIYELVIYCDPCHRGPGGALITDTSPSLRVTPAPLPVPRLPHRPGWHVISTGSNPAPPSAAIVTAATIRLRHDPDGASSLPPLWALEHLPTSGIIVQAVNYGLQRDRNHPPRHLPLTIRGAPLEHGFEGVSRHYSFVRVPARVHGWTVEVYVWFGTPEPTAAQLGRADQEVDRLVFPHH